MKIMTEDRDHYLKNCLTINELVEIKFYYCIYRK